MSSELHDQRLATIDQRLADEARWRGTVDQRLLEHERRLTGINGSVAESAKALSGVLLELSKLTTTEQVKSRLSGWVIGGVSSVGGGIAVGVVVFFITGGS